MNRRQFFALMATGAFLGIPSIITKRGFAASSNHSAKNLDAFQSRFGKLEAAAKGSLGAHILDTASGKEYGYRSDERFMMLSTFKLMASAFVLHRADDGVDSLDRRIPYAKEDLIDWSPITEKHVDGLGMTLAELCEATITTSDNTAANLILSSFGGPAALTAFVRKLGDDITRFDRTEPGLNVKSSDGLLDTATPRATVGNLQKVVLGNVLSLSSRDQLQRWLLNNTTGGRRLRAGLPTGWRIGEKTGTNKTGANDIGVIWPSHRKPIVVAAYLGDSSASIEIRESTLAAIGELVAGITA